MRRIRVAEPSHRARDENRSPSSIDVPSVNISSPVLGFYGDERTGDRKMAMPNPQNVDAWCHWEAIGTGAAWQSALAECSFSYVAQMERDTDRWVNLLFDKWIDPAVDWLFSTRMARAWIASRHRAKRGSRINAYLIKWERERGHAC